MIRRRQPHLLRSAVLGVALAGALLLWRFRGSLRNRITERLVLSNDSPSQQVIEGIIQKAPYPDAALAAEWNSGKIIQREVAIQTLRSITTVGQPLPPELESILLSATLDADMDVRESAFGLLRDRNDPALPALAAAQLRDPDPETRILGLNYLRQMKAAIGVPIVIPLLDDGDSLIVATVLSMLENWSGAEFGVRMRDATNSSKVEAGASRAKAWWAAHRLEFPSTQLDVPREAIAAHILIPVGNFSLSALDGRTVELSDFHGKVVLINFWTTWCTACVAEIPELIELRKQCGENVAILGISLDSVADGAAGQSESALHEKVERTAKARGINYPILLDEKDHVGSRFNGGELPTTVIVDAQGNVRRRFIGPRTLAVFHAMIAEASTPIALTPSLR
ncbi:MAG TPA: TlpA disulfide reductase family protein [Verrucomicrobiae bacterium]|jgi:thiol-disulfide isomerase/thioredoxin|nr:TlpA disulfide reductase family protein [Verrucomicrobiae bacterium]